jgi:hypothetical protein
MQFPHDWLPPAWPASAFYAETFATNMRAISGLSRQTPSLRMTKSRPDRNMTLHKIQHRRIDLRPLRLHIPLHCASTTSNTANNHVRTTHR